MAQGAACRRENVHLCCRSKMNETFVIDMNMVSSQKFFILQISENILLLLKKRENSMQKLKEFDKYRRHL